MDDYSVVTFVKKGRGAESLRNAQGFVYLGEIWVKSSLSAFSVELYKITKLFVYLSVDVKF